MQVYPLIYKCSNDEFRMACLSCLQKTDTFEELLKLMYSVRKSQDPHVQELIQYVQKYYENSSPLFHIKMLKLYMSDTTNISEVDEVWNFFKGTIESVYVPLVHVLKNHCFIDTDWKHVLTYVKYVSDNSTRIIREACLPSFIENFSSDYNEGVTCYNEMMDVLYKGIPIGYEHNDCVNIAKEHDVKIIVDLLCKKCMNVALKVWLNLPLPNYEFAIMRLCHEYSDVCMKDTVLKSWEKCLEAICDLNKNNKGFLEFVVHAIGWYGIRYGIIKTTVENKDGFYSAGCKKKTDFKKEDDEYEKMKKALQGMDMKPVFMKDEKYIYMMVRYSGDKPDIVKYMKELPEPFSFAALYGATEGGHLELIQFMLNHIINITPSEFAQVVNVVNIAHSKWFENYVNEIADVNLQKRMRAAFDYGKFII